MKTLYADLIKAHPRLKLDDDEVVVFLSQTEDNLRLCYGFMELDDGSVVLRSRELRLMKGSWSVLKLKSYAKQANMKITDWSIFDKALRKASDKLIASAKAALKAA
jgi:hypothetical protein